MKTALLAAAALALSITGALAQQQAHPPYGPPPYEMPSPNSPKQMPPDTTAPATSSLPSTEIQQLIDKKVSTEPLLRGSAVEVNVDDDSVVLTGTVDSEQQHDMAVRLAKSYAGSRSVVDRITMRNPV